MDKANNKGKIKKTLKRIGKTILSIIFHFFVMIPAFVFIIYIVVLISIKLPTHGMGKISFLISSCVVFLSLIIFLFYIKKKKLFNNVYFWIFFFIIPAIAGVLIYAITYANVMTRNDILGKKIQKNIDIASARDFYKVPAGKNAAHILKMKEKIPENKREDIRKLTELFFSDKSSLDSLKNAEEIISPYVSLVDSFYKYDYFQYSWPGDYEDSLVMMPIPDLVFIVAIAKAGIVSSYIDIEKNNYNEAYKKMLKLWHIRNIISSEPQLICGMVSNVISGFIIDELTEGVKNGWINRSEMVSFVNKIYSDIENYDPIIPAKPEIVNGKIKRASAVDFEICYMMKWSKKYSRGTSLGWKLSNISFYIDSYPDLILFDFPFFFILSYGALFDYIDILFPDSLSTWENYLKYYYQNGTYIKIEEYKNKLQDNPIPYFSAGMLIPNLEGIFYRETRIITKVRILKSAMELEKIKQKSGKYPSDFNEILIDPFTAKKLIYKTDNKGYKIYSVGKNLKDDGGKEDDIVFEK